MAIRVKRNLVCSQNLSVALDSRTSSHIKVNELVFLLIKGLLNIPINVSAPIFGVQEFLHDLVDIRNSRFGIPGVTGWTCDTVIYGTRHLQKNYNQFPQDFERPANVILKSAQCTPLVLSSVGIGVGR